jgi:hypothetical protein
MDTGSEHLGKQVMLKRIPAGELEGKSRARNEPVLLVTRDA